MADHSCNVCIYNIEQKKVTFGSCDQFYCFFFLLFFFLKSIKGIILNKTENTTPKNVRKSNQNVLIFLLTLLCITVNILQLLSNSLTETRSKFDRGLNFQVYNLKRNLVQFRPSGIQTEEFQPLLDVWEII